MRTQHQQRWARAWWMGGFIGSGLWLIWSVAWGAGGESLYDHIIGITAQQHGLEPALIKAVIKCESGFDKLAVSPRGAQGLMQLMPATQLLLGVTDAFTPQENIAAGVRYLAMLQQLFPSNVALILAAYNAGPQAVLEAGSAIPAFPETQRFVRCVLAAWQRYRQQWDTTFLSGLATALDPASNSKALQVQAWRLSQPVARVGQPVTVSLDAVQVERQAFHGVVMLMYPEHLVSYMMLNASGNATTVRLPGSAEGQLGKVSWVTNSYQILRGDWPEWRPGQRRTVAFALVPRVPQEIALHLSIFLYNTTVTTVQHRWSTVVRVPVYTDMLHAR
jgi:hypothetical protein